MNKNTCPVTGSFCWKNPLQLVAFLALLPYAMKGVAWITKGVAGWFN